jgi:glycosyltransferase involved in cell wall biosynthesis
MITVLHIIDTGGPGGAETVYLNTATGLDKSKFNSVCMVSREGWLAAALRARGADPLVVASSGSLNFGYLKRILGIVRARGVDVIAAHLYGSAVYGSLAGRLSGVPVVSILHGQSDIAGKGRLEWLKRRLLRSGSDAIVFVSHRLQLELANALKIPDSKCFVIANGVDTARFSPGREDTLRRELRLAHGEVLVGAIGNVRTPKAYDMLLHAAHLLVGRSPKYRFAIAGEGSGELFDVLLALRRNLGLESHVNFLGLRSNIVEVLHNLDVYVLSSASEGFSLACVEAMACGVPVVATKCGGPEDIIEDGRSGVLVPVGCAVSLADAIERVAGDPIYARSLARNALTRVRSNFTITAMLNAYERLYATLGAARQAKGGRRSVPVKLD